MNPATVRAPLLCYAGRHNAGGFGCGGNGGGGFPSATYHGNGGGGLPSATVSLRSTRVAPATASIATAMAVTKSKRFMFFLQVDLTSGCLDTAPARTCPKPDPRTPISLAEGGSSGIRDDRQSGGNFSECL